MLSWCPIPLFAWTSLTAYGEEIVTGLAVAGLMVIGALFVSLGVLLPGLLTWTSGDFQSDPPRIHPVIDTPNWAKRDCGVPYIEEERLRMIDITPNYGGVPVVSVSKLLSHETDQFGGDSLPPHELAKLLGK